MKGRFVSFLLAMIMICSIAPMAFAASPSALKAADVLHEFGLFNGVKTNSDGSPNYDLDRAPTRHEAVTMLVRLLGKEKDAKNGTWSIPFTDVADWARPYVGYAYTNGLTNGTSATTFDGNDIVTASQYITFVLRTLGYTSGTDFSWDKAWELSDKIGVTDEQYKSNKIPFLRGDVTIISTNALATDMKNDQRTLAESLGFPIPTKLEASTSEMNARRVDVMESWRSALVFLQDASMLCIEALDYAQYGLYSSATSYAKEAQVKFAAAETETNKAIVLCGDYAENADVKAALQNVANSFAKVTSFVLSDGDPNNLMEFMNLGLAIDSDLPNNAMNEWVLQNG